MYKIKTIKNKGFNIFTYDGYVFNVLDLELIASVHKNYGSIDFIRNHVDFYNLGTSQYAARRHADDNWQVFEDFKEMVRAYVSERDVWYHESYNFRKMFFGDKLEPIESIMYIIENNNIDVNMIQEFLR